MTTQDDQMNYTVAEAKRDLSKILREVNKGPVTITRRGKPAAVLLEYAEYEALVRLQAYGEMLRLSRELKESGVTATELYEASRADLESRS